MIAGAFTCLFPMRPAIATKYTGDKQYPSPMVIGLPFAEYSKE